LGCQVFRFVRLFLVLKGPTTVLLQDRADARQKILGGELLVNTVLGPVGFDPEFVTVGKPKGDLLDGGVLDVERERRLAGGGGGPGQDIAPGVGDAEEGGLKVEG
jgi:hypothetical protein